MSLLLPLAAAALLARWLVPAEAPAELLLGAALLALAAARLAPHRPLLLVLTLSMAVGAAAAAAGRLDAPSLAPLSAPAGAPAVGRVRWVSVVPEGRRVRLEPPGDGVPPWALPLSAPVRLLVPSGGDSRPGDLLLVPARAAAAAALGPPPGREGFAPSVRIAANGAARVARPPSAGAWAVAAREHVSRALVRRAAAAAPVACSLVLGEDWRLPVAERRVLRDLGVSHLLAISGFNLALVAWLLGRALLSLGAACPRLAARRDLRRPVAALVLPAIWAYAAIVAGQPSVVRAALMATAMLGAMLVCRRAPALDALAAAALAVLLATPALAGDPGFQLSLAAVGGLLLAARFGLGAGGRDVHPADEPFRRRTSGGDGPATWWNRVAFLVGRWSGLALLATTFAALATAPIGAWHFGTVSLAAPLANLLAIPLFTFVVYPLAVLATLLAVGPVPDAVAAAAGALSRLAWEAFVGLCERLSRFLPGSIEVGPDGAFGCAVVAAALGLLLLRHAAPRKPALALLLLVAVGRGDPAAGARGTAGPPPPAPGAVVVTFLDVGDADAILLRRADGRAALVDGGLSRGTYDADARNGLPQQLRTLGVHELDLAVVTHAHPDHFAGLAAAVARGLRVRELWLEPQGEVEQPDSAYARFVRELERRGTRVRRTPTLCGKHRWGPATLQVLAPCGPRGYDPGLDENDNSLVVRLSVGCADLLLTGDAGLAAEEELLAENAPLEAEVLKVGHHGSRTASGEAFLALVRPLWSVVSAASHRPGLPGPPHASVLQRLRSAGSEPWWTGRDGALTVHLSPDGLRAWDAVGRPRWELPARCGP
ncbi:MAG: ComEC/Rec2 family competence protein [Deltaproteobacteria bacterium]|nr:ComEC/Rec2 family competence protein [Deltaproteobacteria bacterium]